MFTKASEFTMKDQSSSPYAWMIEGMDKSDVLKAGSVEQFVREYAKTAISTQNASKAKDVTVYKVWRSGWEFNQAVNSIKEMLSE